MTLARRNAGIGQARGFSLVEVVMALAVTTFCLITILGMLGSGLTETRKSEDVVAAANTADAIIGNWRANPSTLLAPGNTWLTAATTVSPLIYVDANGNATASASGAAYAEIYTIVPENVGASAKGYTDVNGDNIPDLYYITLTLEWPPLAVKNSGPFNTYRVLIAIRPS